MKYQLAQTIAALGVIAFAGSVAADTNLLSGGDVLLADGWDNGRPAPGNDATIAVDGILGNSDTFGFGAGTIINHTAGTIDAFSDGTRTGFNLNLGGTWNMSGGKIIARYVLSNGGGTIFNLSGGTVELADVTGTQHFGVANGGTVNISGSVVIDGTQADAVVQTGGAIDIASSWTGSWTWGLYSGTEWRDHFVNSQITLDGAPIDGATFDSTFVVSNFGQTLAITAPVLPTEFNGGDMLAAGNWTNGLPVDPVEGTAPVDGSLDDGNAGIADWLLTITGGMITAGQDWNFTGASRIVMQDGTLDVAGDIRSSDDSVMTFNGGTVSWGGSFGPSGAPGGTISINGGTFNGTSTAATSFGNVTGGILTVSGGSITASSFDFDFNADTSTIGGSAVLSGDTATFGYLDILTNWTGSFTVTGFSGTDWETEFASGNITIGGAFLDAAGFALNFTVSNGGQTLTYTPSTELLVGGNINNPADWTNGLPNAGSPGTIAVDGTIGTTVFGFGDGSVVDMTAGTLTAADGFNMNGGGTWNISGGRIITRYLLSNAQNRPSVINLSGGTIELSDVEGSQFIAVGHGGVLNISGTAMLDATQANQDLPTTGTYVGTIDIKSDWTGTWTWGTHSGYDWENLVLAGRITLDGNVLDLAGFEANFAVTNNGQTLAIGTGGTPDQGEPILVVAGINEFGEFVINASNLNPSKTYDLVRGTDLLTFPDFVGAQVTGVSEIELFDVSPPPGKAFYQLQEPEP